MINTRCAGANLRLRVPDAPCGDDAVAEQGHGVSGIGIGGVHDRWVLCDASTPGVRDTSEAPTAGQALSWVGLAIGFTAGARSPSERGG